MSALTATQNPFAGVTIYTTHDAVINLHRASEMQREVDRIRTECGDYLDKYMPTNQKSIESNGYAVIRVINVRKQYIETFWYKLAVKIMKYAERITPQISKASRQGLLLQGR